MRVAITSVQLSFGENLSKVGGEARVGLEVSGGEETKAGARYRRRLNGKPQQRLSVG